MLRWLWVITGGRPMIYCDHLFVDCVDGKRVNKYIDRLGRVWMANTRWSLFRVRKD